MITKLKITTISLLVFTSTSMVLSESNIQIKSGYVIADGGLNIREKPNINSKILSKLENGLKISWNESDENPKNEIVSGLSGKWTKIKLRDKTGYFFNGFISRMPSFPDDFKSIDAYLNKYFRQISKTNEYEFINNHYQSDVPENEKIKTFREIIHYENDLTYFTSTYGVESSFSCLQAKNHTLQELFLISKTLFPLYAINIEENDTYNLVNGISIKSVKKTSIYKFPDGYEIKYNYHIYESYLNYYVDNKKNHQLNGNSIFIEGNLEMGNYHADTYSYFSSPIPTICIGIRI
ncbi:hypothetical protein AB3N60_11275 [Leptospira sp. WS39.C2]